MPRVRLSATARHAPPPMPVNVARPTRGEQVAVPETVADETLKRFRWARDIVTEHGLHAGRHQVKFQLYKLCFTGMPAGVPKGDLILLAHYRDAGEPVTVFLTLQTVKPGLWRIVAVKDEMTEDKEVEEAP